MGFQLRGMDFATFISESANYIFHDFLRTRWEKMCSFKYSFYVLMEIEGTEWPQKLQKYLLTFDKFKNNQKGCKAGW